MRRKGGFIPLFPATLICQYPLLASNTENVVASTSEFVHSPMHGIGDESWIFNALALHISTQKRTVRSFDTKTIIEAYSVCAGLRTSMASVPFVSWFSNSLVLSPAWYRAELMSQLSVFSSFIWRCTALIEPKCTSHIFSYSANMVTNLSRYVEHSSDKARSLCQSLFKILSASFVSLCQSNCSSLPSGN